MGEVDWSGVRDRVAALASEPAAAGVFGVRHHGFALNPVLTGSELRDAEDAAGVRLPGDYRSFLLEVGNGGAGPGFGVASLGRTGGGWRWTGNDDAAVARLGMPFEPFAPEVREAHEGVVYDDARGSDMPLTPLTGPDGRLLGFGEWYLAWLAEAEAVAARS